MSFEPTLLGTEMFFHCFCSLSLNHTSCIWWQQVRKIIKPYYNYFSVKTIVVDLTVLLLEFIVSFWKLSVSRISQEVLIRLLFWWWSEILAIRRVSVFNLSYEMNTAGLQKFKSHSSPHQISKRSWGTISHTKWHIYIYNERAYSSVWGTL